MKRRLGGTMSVLTSRAPGGVMEDSSDDEVPASDGNGNGAEESVVSLKDACRILGDMRINMNEWMTRYYDALSGFQRCVELLPLHAVSEADMRRIRYDCEETLRGIGGPLTQMLRMTDRAEAELAYYKQKLDDIEAKHAKDYRMLFRRLEAMTRKVSDMDGRSEKKRKMSDALDDSLTMYGDGMGSETMPCTRSGGKMSGAALGSIKRAENGLHELLFSAKLLEAERINSGLVRKLETTKEELLRVRYMTNIWDPLGHKTGTLMRHVQHGDITKTQSGAMSVAIVRSAEQLRRKFVARSHAKRTRETESWNGAASISGGGRVVPGPGPSSAEFRPIQAVYAPGHAGYTYVQPGFRGNAVSQHVDCFVAQGGGYAGIMAQPMERGAASGGGVYRYGPEGGVLGASYAHSLGVSRAFPERQAGVIPSFRDGGGYAGALASVFAGDATISAGVVGSTPGVRVSATLAGGDWGGGMRRNTDVELHSVDDFSYQDGAMRAMQAGPVDGGWASFLSADDSRT